MAAKKVNVQFVVGLAAALVIVTVAVVVVGRRMVYKSAAEHVAAGEKSEATAKAASAAVADARAKLKAARASGDAKAIAAAVEAEKQALGLANKEWDAVAGAYGKAVYKEQTNLAYLDKWVGAIGNLTPQPAEAYFDAYKNLYVRARQSLADAAPTDVNVQRDFLEFQMSDFRIAQTRPSDWDQIITLAEKTLKRFPENSKEQKILRRFRGIARVYQMTLVLDTRPEVALGAKEDLLAALEADPDDGEAAGALGKWYTLMVARAKADSMSKDVDALDEEGSAFLHKYVAERKRVAEPALQLLLSEFFGLRTDKAATTDEARLAAAKDLITKMIDRVEKDDAKDLLPGPAFQVAATVLNSGIDKARERAMALVEKSLSAYPQDVMLRYNRADMEMLTRDFQKSIDLFQELIDTPDMPLSLQGARLLKMRELATNKQSEAALALWEVGTTKEAKEAALERAKVYRDRLEALSSKNNPRLLLIDGKIAYAKQDWVEARRLLTSYNEKLTPPRSDLTALKLLADVQQRTNQYGAAQGDWEAALAMEPNDPRVRVALAKVMLAQNKVPEAIKVLEEGLRRTPNNPELQELSNKAIETAKGVDSKDPVIAAFNAVKEAMERTPPDVDGARKLLRKAVDSITEWTESGSINMIRAAMTVDDRPLVADILKKARAAGVKGNSLDVFEKTMDIEDPNQARLMQIDLSEGDEWTKAILRAQVYRRMGDGAKAREQVQKAFALKPDDAGVISVGFDDAIADGNLDEARRLAKIGSERNLDRSNGLIFQIRLLQREAQVLIEQAKTADAKKKLQEALALAEAAVAKDSNSAIYWRMLGNIRSQNGLHREAIAAFRKALELKNDDLETIKSLIRSYVAAGMNTDALLLARESRERINPDFELADLWLKLEGQFGDVEKAIGKRELQFQRSPKDRNNAIELASLYVRQKKFDLARPVIDSLKQNNADVQVLILESNLYAGLNDKAAHAKCFEDFIAQLPPKDPRVLAIWYEYARSLNSAFNDPDGAIAVLERARTLQSPDEMEVDREIGDTAFVSAGNRLRAGDTARAATLYTKASEAYQRAIDSVKKDEGNRLRYRMIELRLRQGNFEDANRLCDAAAGVSGVTSDVQFHLLKSDARLGAQDLPGAMASLDAAIKIDSKSPLPFYKRGDLRVMDATAKEEIDEVKLADGIADLEQALKLAPTFYPPRKRLVEALFAKGQQGATDRAIGLLKEGIAADPDNDLIRNDLVNAYYARTGDKRAAIGLIEEAMKRRPDPRWLIRAAELNKLDGNLQSAIQYYVRLFKADPTAKKNPMAVRPFMDCLLDLQPRAATGDALQILNDPEVNTESQPLLLLARARALWMERRQPEAVADLQKAYALVDANNPRAVEVFFKELQLIAVKPTEALSLLDRFRPAEGFPESIKFQIIKLKLMADPPLPREGLDEHEAFIARNNTDPKQKEAILEGNGKLAEFMFAMNRFDIAAEIYRRNTVLDPNDAASLNNLAYVMAKFLKKPAEALPLAQKAVQLSASRSDFLDTLGVINMALSKSDDAIKALEDALKATETVPNAERSFARFPIYIHLAECWIQKGDNAKCDQYLGLAEREFAKDPRTRAYAADFDRIRKIRTGK